MVFDGEQVMIDPVNGSDVMWVPTGITTAKFGGFYYAQPGLDHGPEIYHGKITGLAT